MNFPLFKTTVKQNYSIFLIITGVMLMYFVIIAYMFDPQDITSLTKMMEMLPKEMIKAMGFADAPTDLTGFIASFYYGFLVFAFPMIYSVTIGNKLVAKTVDDGSFAYFLTTANSRTKLIVTRGVFLILSLILMFCILTICGIVSCNSLFPNLLEVKAFINLNITSALIAILVAMICFFFSCLFNETKFSLSFGAGVPIMFFLMFMIGGVSEKAEIIKKCSIFNLLDTTAILSGESVMVQNTICTVAISVLFAAAVIIFKKKRLPL